MAKKLKKVKQLDGKKDDFAPTTLSQLLGDTGLSKYQTMQEDEYVSQLNDFNKSDLQAHAIKVGLVPIDDRERLTQRLVREFRKHVIGFRKPNIEQKETVQKIPADLKKILDEGR